MGLRKPRNRPDPVMTLEFERHMLAQARNWWNKAMRKRNLIDAAFARQRIVWVKELISFLEDAFSKRIPDELGYPGRRCAVDDDEWDCRFIYFRVRTEDGHARYLLRDIRHPDSYVYADLEDLRDITEGKWVNVR